MTWDHRYRMLREGEIVRATDEVEIDKPYGWEPVRHTVGRQAPSPLYTSHSRYRRLKSDNAAKTQDPRGCDSGGKIEPVFYGDEK